MHNLISKINKLRSHYNYLSCNRIFAMASKRKMSGALDTARRVMWHFGLYHGKRFPKYATFKIRGAATVTMTALFPVLILVQIILSKAEFAMVTKQLSFFFVFTWVILRILLYLNALPKQRAVEDLLEGNIFNMYNERLDRFIASVWTIQKYLLRSYIPLSLMAVAFFALPPVVIHQFANIPIWTPFHGSKEDVVICVFECCSILLQGILYPIMDCNFVGFASIITAQIGILKSNLEHSTDRDPKEEYPVQERKIQNRLRTCIIHHNAILDLTYRVEDLFSLILFCQIVFGVLELCFSAMQLMTETNREELLFWWLSFLGLTSELMVSCYFAQEIISESSGIIDACYMSEWYTCTPSTRKMFFIIMEQAKRPIALNAGSFFTISFEIFVKVLQTAYSYYAVFSQVYQE